MRALALLIILLLALPTPLKAQEKAKPVSAFFSPDEVASIERAFLRVRPKLLAQAKHVLHCSSIVYLGEDQWTVWLQGEAWTPETDKPNLHIREVLQSSVRLSVLLADGKEKEVALRPNQSLNLLTGTVVEGLY